jgi:PAS domain S-box-containing protein
MDPSGKLVGFARVAQDITAQRREEESLRSIVDHSVDVVITINERGIIQSCSEAVRRVFGRTYGELLGQNISVLMPGPFRGEHNDYLARYLESGIPRIMGTSREVSGVRKDGSTVPLELVITEFQLDGSRFFTGILRDLTDRKNLEEQLRQAQKMEAIGQLAGGVAHDFNNLLTVINGNCELVLTELAAGDSHRGLLMEVARAGNRAADLTSQLLAFGQKQILLPRVLNLNDVVQKTEKLLRRLIGEDVRLVTNCEPALNRGRVDPGQMEQVIINLAVNARDAMPQGGTLTIATGNRVFDEAKCKPCLGCKPGDYVVLTMTDTGCGMTADVMARIFEPFYTTKEIGKGTGLGLAMVYGIVKQSEGCITVDSTVGAGTTFEIVLPTVIDSSASSPSSHGIKVAGHGSETVLLVEDEDGVRKLARHVLEMHGYTVVEASHGREAIEVERNHDGPIHLLITDVVMPEMSGRNMVEAILPRHPGLKVLYMSGYTDDDIVRYRVTDARDAFLQKPFTLPALVKKVREVLDGKV